MPLFNYAMKGDKLEVSAREFYNAVAQAVHQQATPHRGAKLNNATLIPRYQSPGKKIHIRSIDSIEPWSIFTVDYIAGTGSFISTGTGTGGDVEEELWFDPRIPKAFSRQIDGTEAGPVYVVNEQYRMIPDANYTFDILGDEQPVIVNYEEADGIPTVGDALGVKPDTYKVSLEHTGLIAVSGPDLENERVWVVRAGGGGAGQYIRFEIVSVDEADWSALVTIKARPCGVSFVTGESAGRLTVYDPCQCWLTEPAADLVGRCGGARYMQPVVQYEDTGTGTSTGTDSIGCPDTCCWEIDWLCCPACD